MKNLGLLVSSLIFALVSFTLANFIFFVYATKVTPDVATLEFLINALFILGIDMFHAVSVVLLVKQLNSSFTFKSPFKGSDSA